MRVSGSSFSRSSLWIGIAAVLTATPSWGHCGLEGCPREGSPEGSRWRVRGAVEARRTAFTYLRIDGDYLEIVPRVEVVEGGWQAGVLAPLVTLHFLEDTRTGAGNPVFFGQLRVSARPTHDLYVGMQGEAPWGDTEHGLADDHAMLVPYARSELRTRPLTLATSLGYRFTVFESEASSAGALAPDLAASVASTSRIAFHAGHSHAAPTLVDPHEDRELLWRALVTTARPFLRVTPALSLDGQHVVRGTEDERTFLQGGLGLRVAASRMMSIETQAAFPLTSAKRFDWRLSGAVRLR